MHPVLFHYGFFKVYTYGFMFSLAVACSLYLILREAGRLGYNKDTVLDLFFVILLSGIVGARALFIFLNLDFYWGNPREIFMLHHGGLAVFGGFISAIISAIIYLKVKRAPFLRMFDLFAPFVALAHSIGRIGCFFNGCCYGLAYAWGIYSPLQNAVLIPAQLIDSFLLLMLFVFLRVLQAKNKTPGRVFAFYLILYSLTRFCVEFIRGDSPRLYLGLTIFQLFSILFFMFGLAVYFKLRPRSNIK